MGHLLPCPMPSPLAKLNIAALNPMQLEATKAPAHWRRRGAALADGYR